jgi:trigger factor
MNISRHEIDQLNAEITIELTPEDYESRVNEGIKKVQRKAQMPGFRPGKVPAGIIKKQYGGQIFADELNKLLNDTIYKYIEDNKLEILGNPLPKENNELNPETQKDLRFVYELGLSPEFDLTLDEKIKVIYRTAKIDDALIDKYIKDVRRNHGKSMNPEIAEEKDVLFVDINELDETSNIKAGGIFKSTSVSPERVKNEVARQKLLGARNGDKIVMNINELYETALDKSISLGIDKETAETADCMIQLTVKNISRLEDAEVNQELFDKVYGAGNITSEEAFREKIREELRLMFAADSERFFIRDVQEKLLETSGIQLPDDFLKRWLLMTGETKLSSEELEKQYPEYAKAMKWQLIQNRIVKDEGIKIDQEDVLAEARDYVRKEYARYGYNAPDEEIEKIAKDLSMNKEQGRKIVDSVLTGKVINAVRQKITIEETELGYDEFFAGAHR